MRRFLAGPLVLILALNGIACACPSRAGAVETIPQHQHQAQIDTESDCHEDNCEGNCNVVPAGKSLFKAYDYSPAALPVQFDQFGLAAFREASRAPPNDNPTVLSNPVSLRDRMLD